MKNKYCKLKLTILLQAMFITSVTVLVGSLILVYFVDGVYNDSFANIFLRFMKLIRVDEESAISMYWNWIGHNKLAFMIIGFLALFALFAYIGISSLTKYLDQIGDGIESILSDSDEPIKLITELKPLEERMNEIKTTIRRQEKEAEETEQKKNDLVLFLAHDLKTPLTSVVAYLTMLEEHPDMTVEERARYTHISLEKAIRLGELINEFFEITKFNLYGITLEMVELDLGMMLEQIADELYAVLQGKGLECHVEVQDDLLIMADPDKLARVFDNILRNAIAYCKADSIISIRCRGDEKEATIAFENEGQTIAEEALDKIFEKFYREDAARSSSTGGAGLGLAIAREIVELHGGTIRAESQNGKTRFIVVLPKKKGIEENEIYTHRRRTSWSMSERWKGLHRK